MKLIYFFFLFFIDGALYSQIITTIAGNDTYGYSGDGGPATSAQLAWQTGIAADNAGNIYIADHDNNVIRKVNSAGIISTFAGNGTLGFTGDGGAATSASLYHPGWITVDNSGNIYFTDQNSEVIRKVNTAGMISTVTGYLPSGYSGDGGPLIAAQFRSIAGISFDKANNMYISDNGNYVIRKVNSAGIISTMAGNGTAGFSGDGGPATSAQLGGAYAVVFDNTGNMYIPDNGNSRIRKVNTGGIITTMAGKGTLGYSGDGGPAINAELYYPWAIAIDNANNIYVGDPGNYTVRKIDPAGIINAFAGNGTYGNSGDGGPATSAQLGEIAGLAIDNSGNIYVSVRTYFYVIKKINTCLTASVGLQPSNVTLCDSGNAVFIMNADNTDSYQWQLNTGTGWNNLTDNNTYSGSVTSHLNVTGINATMNSYQYRCMATNACGNIFSSSATLTVTTPLVPSLTITTIADTICAGTTAIFTATPLNGGLSPSYQWKKNGINAGTNSDVYIDKNLTDGDIITCFLISNGSCITTDTASGNAIIMKVNTVLTPSVTISPSVNNICSGTPVTFTAVSTNGGANPSFQWMKNGINFGTNSPACHDSSLNNRDSITCIITSGYGCFTASAASSNLIVMSVTPLESPSIIISTTNTSICAGAAATWFAVPTNGGAQPFYQWKKNGTPVGSNSSDYTDQHILNGDMINCTLTSNSKCLTVASATSNSIFMTVLVNPVVSLDKTPTLCAGSSRQLDAGNYISYEWDNGITERTLLVNSPGKYYVTVTDNNSCKGSDTANITRLLPSPTNFLPNDTAICSYGSLSLNAKAGYQNYLWNNNSTGSSITVVAPGLYWLEVADNNNCRGRDSVLVSPKNCLEGFYIPTAFSPNNDGKNDLFKPLVFGNLKSYLFIIYNRYGQTIFQTTDLAKGWDGSIGGLSQNGNVFVWTCSFQFAGMLKEFKKGTVILIR